MAAAIGAIAGGAIGGAGGGLISGGLNYVYNKKLMRISHEFQKWVMRNRYQMQAQDMTAAGLSKSLAYGQAPPGPSGGGASASGGQIDPGGGAIQALLARKQLQKMDAEVRNTEQATRESGARTTTEEATRGLKMAQMEADRGWTNEKEIHARWNTYLNQAQTFGQELLNKKEGFGAGLGEAKTRLWNQSPELLKQVGAAGSILGSGISGAQIMRAMTKGRKW